MTNAKTFGVGAAVGFLSGAFVMSAIVWQFGNIIGTRDAADRGRTPAAIERWADSSTPAGIDDAGEAVIEGGAPVVATSGESPVATPPPSTEAVIGSVPADELEERDLVIPVEGIGPDKLVRTFHDKRGSSRIHEAIDILAPRNTPVRAIEGGKIARLFYSKAGGITIYQYDPTERFCYYYAHLERYADGLREGQQVRKGQVIGYVGVSGNAPKDTPHLHFAIFRLGAEKRWWEGTPIDPYDVLR